MVLFKINGERNSGTNFLTKLLQLNNFPVYTDRIEGDIYHHWKHGVPDPSVKELDERVVDIFIFRDLEKWLQSMSVNVYHLHHIPNFGKFLTCLQNSRETRYKDVHGRVLNHDDNGKTIFQIRYYKFNEIMKYREQNKDIILINLSYLQNAYNVSLFLSDLNKRYFNNQHRIVACSISTHTKHGGAVKNTNYMIDLVNYKTIIHRDKDKGIENFIKNLTYDIKE